MDKTNDVCALYEQETSISLHARPFVNLSKLVGKGGNPKIDVSQMYTVLLSLFKHLCYIEFNFFMK